MVVRWPPSASLRTPESAVAAARASIGSPGPENRGRHLIAGHVELDAALAVDLFRLAHLRSREPAVVNGNAELADDRGLVGARGAERGVGLHIARGAALRAERRQQGALGDLHRE